MLPTAEKFFKVFADRNRLRIVNLLQSRKMCVCELAFVLQVTQPSVSRHLRKMKEAGLIGDEQDGFWTNYFLRKEGKTAQTVFACLRSFLKDDRILKADRQRLKKAQRTATCCK